MLTYRQIGEKGKCMTEKSREQKLRREAKRRGLYASKNRNDYGQPGWMILNRNNIAEAGYLPVSWSLTLEEAEKYVYEYND